ncbi:MAG: hypothetical protein KQH57_10385 [Actinomycetales bacterium]|nr:hypothetical protein [Actinomycetales bacterium]
MSAWPGLKTGPVVADDVFVDGGTRVTADSVTPGSSGAAGAWQVRTELDPEGSQGAWFRAALLADELDLAHRIATAPLEGGGPQDADADLARDALAAEALVVLGRGGEAAGLLRERGVRPPRAGEPVSWPQALLAAGQASTGDAGAWAWLSARTTDVAPAFRLRLARLVAAAAEQRGDLGVADAAWAEIPGLIGAVSSPRLAGRIATATLLRRNREAEPLVLATAVIDALSALQNAAADDAAALDAVLEVAGRLERRGDDAGARLLLGAARSGLPRDRRVRAALRRLSPRSTFADAARVVVAVAVLAAAVVAGAVWHLRAAGLVGAGALGLYLRLAPVPGFTRPEGQVWQGVRTLRYDPAVGRADTSGGSGWYGLAGIGGFVVTFIVMAIGLTALGEGGSWPAWSVSSAGMVGMLAVLVAGTAGGVLGARSLRHALGRRRRARSRAADHALAERHATVCRCREVDVTWGPDARLYAERHLVPAPVPPPVRLPGGELRLCPVSSMPWLVGPLGAGGRELALRGALREVANPVAEDESGRTGFYL